MTDAVPTRPNVLFVITDQQRADHVGFAGNDVVRTPNLDSIAERGMVFENAWVANPVCMPNRSSIMTGRMPTAHGVIMNDRSLDWGANTHVRQFRAAGYRTALIGKSHLQHGMSRNSVRAVDAEPAVTDPWPAGWDTLEHFERYAEGQVPDWPQDFYGFDNVELAIDHGARITGHHLQWALGRGGRYEDFVVPYGAEAPALERDEGWWQIYRPPYDPEFHSTNFVTERTIAFIEEAHAQARPWLAWASFPDPHHPFTPPGEWYDRHDPDDMEIPSSFADPLTHAPEYVRHIASSHPSSQRGWVQPTGAGGDERLVRQAIAKTYGMIEFIDEGVGRLLATLERLGVSEDTIVVFTSDHGDMMGDHGLMLKGFLPFRGTLQPPLVIADPRRPSGRTASLASSIDIASTLLEIAGLDAYVGMQGRSLVPVLDDPGVAVRDSVLIEDDLPTGLAARSPIPAKTRSMVTDDGLKLTRNSDGDTMLFDLVADPTEVNEIGHVDAERRALAMEGLTDAMILHADDARGAPVRA